jgi:TRAP-type C4-dicarboxylate transport system permease small subunit
MEKWVLGLSTVFSFIAMGLLLVLATLDSADVIGRYSLNMPIQGTLEISEILLAGVVFFGWGYTQSIRGHVSVSFLVSRFPRRVQAIVDFMTSLLMLILLALIVWQGTETAVSYWQSNRLITTIEWPLYPFQLFVPIGALAFCLVLIIQMLHLLTGFKKED